MLEEKAPSVLIVEDERIVATDLQETLNGLGYDAFAIAASADEALARADERKPDLVLMDIRIKGPRDGIDTAIALRQRYDVPIVYLTAHADQATIERAKKTEPHGYVLKPVRSAELRSAVEVSIYKHGMERRLRARERWFSTTLRSIADAVVATDAEGKVSFMNPVAEELTGVRLDDALGRPSSEVVRLFDARHPTSPLDHVLQRKAALTIEEAELRHAGGTSRVINDSAAPVIDAGEVLGAVMVFRDVTERKALQRQLEVADRLASLGLMAAGVAHEVNNPLAVVVANGSFIETELREIIDQLKAGRVDAANVERLEAALEAQEEVQSGAHRIGRIVAELKAFSRPAPSTTGRADVASAVAWATRATAHELRHRARLFTELQPVPEVAIDETRLGQVLVNLLINAAHAITPGKIEHNSITVVVRLLDERHVSIELRDTGSGIEPEVLSHIFEPFFTTKAVGVGTGLGLSICRNIVTSVGGDLKAQSVPGSGTTFRVVLPVATRADVIAGAAPAPLERRGRLLVVDDEELVLRAIVRSLREHELLCVGSAREALALIDRGERFDLVISDLMMPEMTGMEFYEALVRSHPEVAGRMVFLSGGAVSESMMDFLKTVPVPLLQKPFALEELKALVQKRLEADQHVPA